MNFDALIIGFGKGGKTLCGALAKKGQKVALVERSQEMYGGTCINVGCIPSKSLVTSSHHIAKENPAPAQRQERYEKAIQEKKDLVEMLRQKNYAKLDNLENVTIIHGEARFLNDTTVAVSTPEEELTLTADRIFINTGASSFIPPIAGISDNPFIYTSESMLSLTTLPQHLTIIGGGYIGLEFASMYCDFGAQVTILQMEDTFVPREDREVARAWAADFEKRGITVVYGATIKEIKEDTVEYTQEGKEYAIKGDAILVATGRRPNVAGLGIENTSIALTNRGAIATDEHRRTSVEHIWAMGDVVGDLQFTYISLDDYRIVLSDLFDNGKYTLKDRKNVPYAVFTAPPLGRIGLNEEEAKAQGLHYLVKKLPAAAIPKAQVLQTPQGLLKAIIDEKTHEILGATLYCAGAHEIINLIKMAMDYHVPYEALANTIYTHPTMAEAFNDLFA